MHDEVVNQITEKTSRKKTLFKPASWQTKIDFINHLILFNKVLITVLAEKSGGKTAFAQLLQENLNPQIKSYVIRAQDSCDQDIFMDTIADALLQNEKSKPLTMNSIVNQINEAKSFVLLIVDNAQNLPEALIKEAVQAIQQQKDSSYFNLCLISDFSAVATYINITKEVEQGIIHSIELATLSENETKTYISHKYAKINGIYTDAQLSHLYKMTGGCIAKINNYLANKSSIEFKEKNYSRSVKPFLISAIFSIMILGISWIIWTNNHNDSKSPKFLKSAKINEQPQILRSKIANWQEGNQEVLYQESPKQVLAALDEKDLNEQQEVVVEKVVEIPSIDINKAIHISQPEAPSFITPIKKKIETAHIKKLSAAAYTIQLLASHQKSDIYKFIRQYALTGKCTIRKVINNKDSWFVLTMGEYATSEQAKHAVHNLPLKISQVKPWVRITSNLQLVG